MNRNVKFLWINPLYDEMIPKKIKMMYICQRIGEYRLYTK